MTDTKLVVTLLAEKGKKYDETRQCISSYDESIVFLPRDVSPGQIVRVELTPVEKKDARGNVMYNAAHAWFDLAKSERHAIAREAEILRTCATFSRDEALALLSARFGNALDSWKGYSHYYFHPAGAVYGSKYAPATLVLFEVFKDVSWKALVEPLLWIAAGVKPVAGDLFSLRQEGKEIDWRFDLPQLTDEKVGQVVGRTAKGDLLLSSPLVEVDSSGRFDVPGWEENEWRKASFPALDTPDLAADPSATIPDVIEFAYGRDVEGTSLVAYGVLGATESWGAIRFSPTWKKTMGETEVERHASMLALLRFREKLQADRVRAEEEARRAAEAEVARIAAEAEVARKAEEAARMRSEVEAGRALADFSAFVHTSGARGDGGGFVIRSGGSLREHDRDEYSRSHARGTHTVHWEYVFPDELALTWSGFRGKADRDGEIHHVPVGGYSPEQLATMSRLTAELGCKWVDAMNMGLLPTAVADDPPVPTPQPTKSGSGRFLLQGSRKVRPRPPVLATSEQHSRADRISEIDPDNPFAILAALKKKLEQDGKN